MRQLGIVLLACTLAGCATNGMTAMLEAIGKDPATVCAKIVYGPAVAQVYRTNAASASVKCNNDGLEVQAVK